MNKNTDPNTGKSTERKIRLELRTDSNRLLLPLTSIALAFSEPAFQLLRQPVVAVLTHRFQVDLYKFVPTRTASTWRKRATGGRRRTETGEERKYKKCFCLERKDMRSTSIGNAKSRQAD